IVTKPSVNCMPTPDWPIVAFWPDYTQDPMRSTLPPEAGSAHSIVRTPQTSSRGKRAPVVASGSIRTAIALAAAWEEGGAGARACSRRPPPPALAHPLPGDAGPHGRTAAKLSPTREARPAPPPAPARPPPRQQLPGRTTGRAG